METLLRSTAPKPLSKRRRGRTEPCPFLVHCRVYDLTDTDEGRKVMERSEATDSNWRAVLEGKILSMRPVRVERHVEWRGKPDTNPETSTGIEVTTAHGTGFVLAFQGRGQPDERSETLGAFVCSNRRQAYLTGTWKKHGHTVGHFCAWIDSMTFKVGRATQVPRGGKYVSHSCSYSLLMDAAHGLTYEAQETEAYKTAQAELKAAFDGCHKRYELRHAQWVMENVAA